ncbi:alpha-L-arabinofuranosidase, partial [bacterium]|nr:alpha-L-arabinofuranosidase [bacterium]
VPMAQLDPYVQDALDLIEFANGPVTSTWGKKRAAMGHPKPFNLKFIGVGNENWGPQYLERLVMFQKAIKAKYPKINIVASSGTDPNGERFDYLNTALRKMNIELIDEHYYRKPEWFQDNVKRYDNYPRNGSKVFAGEYAAHPDKTIGPNKNNWFGAISEAAFLTGLERNADVVRMASYAPLFAHLDAWQWAPDLIWVDNLRVLPSPSYLIQKLFSLNKGHKIIPALLGNQPIAGQDSLFATSSIDTVKKELIVKIVNTSSKEQQLHVNIQGVQLGEGKGMRCLLQNQDLQAMAIFEKPDAFFLQQDALHLEQNMPYAAAPYSVNILRIQIK